jgi:tetratricopeptide (TPR) repeat protein
MPADDITLIKTTAPQGAGMTALYADAASAISAAEGHRLARRFEEAENILAEALKTFPDNPSLLICFAWVAHQNGKLEDALERWARVRIVARSNPVGYSAAVQVHQKLGQHQAADALAMDGLVRFPGDGPLLVNHAWAAHQARRWPEAARRWQAVREHAPDGKLGYVQGANALREGGDLAGADALLAEGLRRFPDDRELLTSSASLATQGQNWIQAWRRWRGVRVNFSDARVAYLLEARALFRLRAFEEAEMVALAGANLFPDDGELVLEAARCASRMKRHVSALPRWEKAFQLVPHIPSAAIGYAEALTHAGAAHHADTILTEANARFPDDAATAIAFARQAVEHGDWAAAETRWRAAHQKHSANRAFAAAANEAAMKALLHDRADLAGVLGYLAGTELPLVQSPGSDLGAVPEIEPRVLFMSFESLGYNCEFGIVQRHFGAEPLSLLRWTATEPDILATALNNQLDGVGLPENTRIVLDSDYRTKDTRYFMLMHTFILPSQATPEELLPKFCKRLQYLRVKLLDDLRAAEKIFLYKAVAPITDEQIMPLWRAVSAYGPNTLVVARIAESGHPAGSVRVLEPGLIVGYFDRTSTTDPSFGVWLEICRRSYAIWQAMKSAAPLPLLPSAESIRDEQARSGASTPAAASCRGIASVAGTTDA